MSGFETFKPNGGAQFMADKGTLPLYTKQTMYVSTSGAYNSNTFYLPTALSPDKTPIIAVKPPSNSNGMTKSWEWLWEDNEMAQTGNRGGAMFTFPSAQNTNGSAYDVYVFSNVRNLSSSTRGLQYFDGAGALVYDLNDKPFRVVDSFQTGWQYNNPSWTETRTYDANRQYALVVTNTNSSRYLYYTGRRQYDPGERAWIYYYGSTGYYQQFKPVSGGFQFLQAVGGGDSNEEYYGPPNSSSSAQPVADQWQIGGTSQRFMVIDVTGY